MNFGTYFGEMALCFSESQAIFQVLFFGSCVPKGGRTVNWVGESPNYIPCKHETNRNTFDDRTNNSVAITGGGCCGRGVKGHGMGGSRIERSRNRGWTVVAEDDHRTVLTGTSFLLLAIKAIMQCYRIRVPTLKYDKTIQMRLDSSVPSFLRSSALPRPRWFRRGPKSDRCFSPLKVLYYMSPIYIK